MRRYCFLFNEKTIVSLFWLLLFSNAKVAIFFQFCKSSVFIRTKTNFRKSLILQALRLFLDFLSINTLAKIYLFIFQHFSAYMHIAVAVCMYRK